MAYVSSWDEPTPSGGGMRTAIRTTLWAVGTLGAFVAVLLWSYELGVRSPADVPALQVALGDWRAAPDDSGGRVVPDQDRQVYERFDGAADITRTVLGGSGAERLSAEDWAAAREATAGGVSGEEFLALVEESAQHSDLAARQHVIDLDLQRPRASEAIALNGGPPDAPPVQGADAAQEAMTPAQPGTLVENEPPSALAPAIQDEMDEPPAVADVTDGTASAIESLASDAAVEDGPVIADVNGRSSADVASQVDRLLSTGDVTPQRDVVVAGAPRVYQVQLGALDSVELAEERWAVIRASEPTLLGGFDLDVQAVNIDGARLYRLRIGAFDNRDDAARLCLSLRTRGIECFPAAKQ